MSQTHPARLDQAAAPAEIVHPRSERVMVISRSLLGVGLAFAAMSQYFTLVSAWDPLFEAPLLPDGPTHPNYYAFRLFTATLGASLIMLYCMFTAKANRIPQLWTVMLVSAVSYFAGWWLAWPLFGYRAPSLGAELLHVLATGLSLAGILLARKSYLTRRTQR